MQNYDCGSLIRMRINGGQVSNELLVIIQVTMYLFTKWCIWNWCNKNSKAYASWTSFSFTYGRQAKIIGILCLHYCSIYIYKKMSTVKCYHWTSLHLMYSSDLKDLNIFNLSLAFIETAVGLELKNHGNTICLWCTFLVIYWKKKSQSIGEDFDWGIY